METDQHNVNKALGANRKTEMIMKFKIRIVNLETNDTQTIEQIADILVAGFKEHWDDAWPDKASALEEVQKSLAKDRISRVALDEKGNVVGWVGGIPEYDGNVWELHPLVVKPENQESGIGRALVQDFEEQVKARGGLTIMLGSDDQDNMTSLADKNLHLDVWKQINEIQNLKRHPYEFYQKLGYVIVGVVPDANGLGKPDILMSKSVAR